ncbi:hypothetical protein MMC16_005221 [Acarospora aff. strigata]|nr:hypothetical protein [Acarospora aff. strigata]
MSEQIKELTDIPKDFLRDGTLFLNRCTKRPSPFPFAFPCSTACSAILSASELDGVEVDEKANEIGCDVADKREFIKISQAVGIGFVVMGAIGLLEAEVEGYAGGGSAVEVLE